MTDVPPPSQNLFGRGYAERGDDWLARGEHRQAAADYCRAIALDGADAGVYARLGEAFAALGDEPQARKALAGALHLAAGDGAVRDRVLATYAAAGIDPPTLMPDADALKGFTPPPRPVVPGATPTLGQVGPRLPGVAPSIREVKEMKQTAPPPAKRGQLAKDGVGITSRTTDLLAEFREPPSSPLRGEVGPSGPGEG